MVTWGIVFALILALAYFSSRMVRQEDEGFQDAGLAILEFGRAFPQEAIRSLHATADGKAVTQTVSVPVQAHMMMPAAGGGAGASAPMMPGAGGHHHHGMAH